MRKAALTLMCSLVASAYGFEEKPWFGELWEFYLDGSYNYSRYDSVANAVKPLKDPSNNHLFTFDLGLVPLEDWDATLEVEFADTPSQSLGRRSVAAQLRTLWLNDIIGDAVSFSTGILVQQTSFNSLRDISSPHSARWDFELHGAVGKEWACGADWCTRLYGMGALGQGSSGSPWTRADVVWQLHKHQSHTWEFYSLGYWGFGKRHEVNIHKFKKGWGSYDHSSIDVGLGYLYQFSVWGTLRLDYAYRVYAYVFPRGVNSLTVSYHFPFSMF